VLVLAKAQRGGEAETFAPVTDAARSRLLLHSIAVAKEPIDKVSARQAVAIFIDDAEKRAGHQAGRQYGKCCHARSRPAFSEDVALSFEALALTFR
jgi:hypothetical protein